MLVSSAESQRFSLLPTNSRKNPKMRHFQNGKMIHIRTYVKPILYYYYKSPIVLIMAFACTVQKNTLVVGRKKEMRKEEKNTSRFLLVPLRNLYHPNTIVCRINNKKKVNKFPTILTYLMHHHQRRRVPDWYGVSYAYGRV